MLVVEEALSVNSGFNEAVVIPDLFPQFMTTFGGDIAHIGTMFQ
jgi:hypothetical protein